MEWVHEILSLRTRRVITLIAAICGFGLYAMSGQEAKSNSGPRNPEMPPLIQHQPDISLRIAANTEQGMDEKTATRTKGVSSFARTE
jgi:hypothetical protein